MPDPDRIPAILEAVREVWAARPEAPLTRLLLDACRQIAPRWPDVWDVEDEALLAALNQLRREASRRRVWVLRRQDDNGATFDVEVFPDPDRAESARAAFDASTHQQRYWIEEREDRDEDVRHDRRAASGC